MPIFGVIPHFIKSLEYMYKDIRNDIYNEAQSRKNLLLNVFIETEEGKMRMQDYIEYIKIDDNYGGDFGLSIAYDLYKYCNILQFMISIIILINSNLSIIIITIMIKIKIYWF